MRKFLSIFLTMLILISSTVSAFAGIQDVLRNQNTSERTQLGNYEYEVIQNGREIIVNEYDADTLISQTFVNVNKDEIVKEFVDDEVTKEIYSKSEMMEATDLSLSEINSKMPRATSWKQYGKYTLQGKHVLGGDTFTTQALLNYYIDRNDSESYTVKANKGDAISVVVGICANILLLFLTEGASLAVQLGTQVAAAGGSAVINGVIQANFTERVGVNATYYKTKYTDLNGGGTGSIFNGKKVQVTTTDSKYYNKIFYEGHAPQRYSENAGVAFNNTYSGGQRITSSKMLSFQEY